MAGSDHATSRVPAGERVVLPRSLDARRWFRAPAWALVGLLTVWTLAILLVPAVRFNIRWPSARLPLEAPTLSMAAFALTFAYLRYSVGGPRSLLFVSLAFLALADYHVLSELLIPGGAGSDDLRLYTWTAGRLVMAALLIVGSTQGNLRRGPSEQPLRDFAVWGLGVTTVVVAVELSIRLGGDSLPPLASSANVYSELETGAVSGLSALDLALGITGMALFLIAAYRYDRVGRSGQNTFAMVLAPALVIAAFSHLHYMLAPTVFSDRVASGELLRLTFVLTVVAGLVWEVRPAYLIERSRSRALEAAYLIERERAAELEAADRARAEMLSLLAHELMHPVVAIRATVLAMLKREDAVEDTDRHRSIRALEAQSLELKRLTDQIAAGARGDGRPFELVRSRRTLGETVDELVAALGKTDRELRITVEGDRRLEIDADQPRMIQVVRNLVSNAVKFSPQASPVRLDVADSGHDLIVSVIDEGAGLVEGEEELVFRPFFRSASARA